MAIKIDHLNYVYSEGTAFEKHALKDVNLEIPDGQFIGVDRTYRIRKVDPDPAPERAFEGNERSHLL